MLKNNNDKKVYINKLYKTSPFADREKNLSFSFFSSILMELRKAFHGSSRTGGSFGWALGRHAGGREFDSGRTNTQGLKITE